MNLDAILEKIPYPYPLSVWNLLNKKKTPAVAYVVSSTRHLENPLSRDASFRKQYFRNIHSIMNVGIQYSTHSIHFILKAYCDYYFIIRYLDNVHKACFLGRTNYGYVQESPLLGEIGNTKEAIVKSRCW